MVEAFCANSFKPYSALGSGCYYYASVTGEETEAQVS